MDMLSGEESRKAVTGTVLGRVQGVSFRYSMQQMAMDLNIRGWVRNLPDASVEFHAEGDPAALDKILRWASEGPSFARVDEVRMKCVVALGLTKFEIQS